MKFFQVWWLQDVVSEQSSKKAESIRIQIKIFRHFVNNKFCRHQIMLKDKNKFFIIV